jgi:hypothetical protein
VDPAALNIEIFDFECRKNLPEPLLDLHQGVVIGVDLELDLAFIKAEPDILSTEPEVCLKLFLVVESVLDEGKKHEDWLETHSFNRPAIYRIAIYCWHLGVYQIKVNFDLAKCVTEGLLCLDDCIIVDVLALEAYDVVFLHPPLTFAVEYYLDIGKYIRELILKFFEKFKEREVADVQPFDCVVQWERILLSDVVHGFLPIRDLVVENNDLFTSKNKPVDDSPIAAVLRIV